MPPRIFESSIPSYREKFDPNGDYVRKWVPERADLSNKLIHKPTPADAGLFEENYPTAIVEHGFARKRALAAFGSLSGKAFCC